MTNGDDGASKKSFRFSDAVQAIQASFRGPVEQRTTTRDDDNTESSRLVIHAQHNEQHYTPDCFPQLSLEHLRDVLLLDQTAQEQVVAAHEEAKLNWDLDARLVGGQRSDSNMGMARVFALLNQISLAKEGSSRNGNDVLAAEGGGTYIDTEGIVVAAPNQEGVSWQGQGSKKAGDRSEASAGAGEVFRRQYETHDLLRAIDRKDTMTILTIRDANFDLLLDLSQGGVGGSMASGTINTPLGYCIGLGNGWEGVAVVMTGALSKFVNNLPDEDDDFTKQDDEMAGLPKKQRTKRTKRELDPRTLSRLRKLRTSLKLAIDHSIAMDQTRLLSSYLQVLLMSTGQTFIRETTDSVHQALLTLFSGSQISSNGKILSRVDPIQVASQSITSFFTESLKTKSQLKDVSQRIASVDDLIANCIGDFLLMAIWQDVQLHRKELARLVKDDQRKEVEGKAEEDDLMVELPTWSFARDDRITTIFSERIWKLEKVIDLIEWESKGSRGTSATKSSRNARIWRCAKEIVAHFGSEKKRPSSKDRLEALRTLLY